MQIQTHIRSNLQEMLNYATQILKTDLSNEVHFECLTACKYWCRFSTETLVPSPDFIELIFSLIGNQHELYFKAVNIIVILLSNYKRVKALSCVSVQSAMEPLPEQDQQFMQVLINYLVSNKEKFLAEANKQFDELEDDTNIESKRTRKFTKLLVTLCSNYEVFLLNDVPETQ